MNILNADIMNSEVVIDYTNWKGVRSLRTIIPRRLFFGNSEYHPDPQWLLEATDTDKGETRSFAMRDIHSWNVPRAQGSELGRIHDVLERIEKKFFPAFQ